MLIYVICADILKHLHQLIQDILAVIQILFNEYASMYLPLSIIVAYKATTDLYIL